MSDAKVIISMTEYERLKRYDREAANDQALARKEIERLTRLGPSAGSISSETHLAALKKMKELADKERGEALEKAATMLDDALVEWRKGGSVTYQELARNIRALKVPK